MKLKRNGKQAGLSLIEVILYLGLFAVILVALSSLFQEVVFLNEKVKDQTELSFNGQYALRRLSAYIGQAKVMVSPVLGSESNSLTLELNSGSNSPVSIYAANGSLQVKEGDNTPVAITNNRVQVDQVNFANYSFPNQLGLVQISLKLSSRVSFWQNQPLILQTSVMLTK